MKKKLLTILLSVFMTITATTINVFADTNVAKIDDTEYTTLQEAIDHVNNGEEIIVINDITCGNPITINNGNTFTINFIDGSTQHTFKWLDDATDATHRDKDIFTIQGNSNVTVKDMKYLIDSSERGNKIFKVNNTGTLTLKDMICDGTDSIKDTPVVNNGGTVTIDGGNINITNINEIGFSTLNPVVQNLGGTTTITGDGEYTTQNNTGAVWIGRVITNYNQSTDADRDSECGTVIIENGTFNDGHILDVNGKANITINDATTGTQNGPAIKTFHGGIKSKITINNITSSTAFFSQVIEKLETKIDFQNGNVKYTPTRFCVDRSFNIMYSVSIKNGKFGPSDGTTDIEAEITNLLADGATLTALASDPNGYTYEVVGPVCMIGSTGYATLDAALTTVTSGQTITLLEDISYNDGQDFVIDGKTVTIDFKGHSITVNPGFVPTTVNKLFTVTNSGSLTIEKGIIFLLGMNNTVSPFTVTGTGSSLTLNNYTQENNLSYLLTLDGGTATINGGTFGTSDNATKIFLANNATLKLTNNPIFNLQGNLINIGGTTYAEANANTDPDTLMGNVTIESGTFNVNGTNTTSIVALYGKANVTINNATFTSSNNFSAPIFIGNFGYKSSLTINNLTSDSPYVFESNNNSYIESFTSTINDGHYKYTKGQFAIDRSNNLKPNIQLKGGYYGPNTVGADALTELTANCAPGYQVVELTSSDPEYANDYRYKVVTALAPPTPPAPTPEPDPTPGYKIPKTGVE